MPLTLSYYESENGVFTREWVIQLRKVHAGCICFDTKEVSKQIQNGLGNRESDKKAGSFAWVTFYPDLAPMEFY
jgi:hypothetical protein